MIEAVIWDFGGVLTREGGALPLAATRLDGARLRFTVSAGPAARTYAGEVRGGAIVGEGWRADR